MRCSVEDLDVPAVRTGRGFRGFRGHRNASIFLHPNE